MNSADRLPFCGGTDAAAIMCSATGEPYYRSAFEVWAERHAPEAVPAREPQEQAWLDLGTALEAHVLGRYAAERLTPEGLALGAPLQVPGPTGYEWMRGSLDAPIFDAEGRIAGLVDAKTSRQRHHWFANDEDGTRLEAAPVGYVWQVTWYLGLLRLAGHVHARFADLAALDLMSASLDVRTFEHEEYRRWGPLTDTVVPWWERHIIGGERPADDHSEACKRWYSYCKPRQKGTRQATPDEVATVQAWRKATAARASAEAVEAACKLSVLSAMDTERLSVGEGKAAPYVQIQAGPKGSRVLRAYRFETTTPASVAGPTGETT